MHLGEVGTVCADLGFVADDGVVAFLANLCAVAPCIGHIDRVGLEAGDPVDPVCGAAQGKDVSGLEYDEGGG